MNEEEKRALKVLHEMNNNTYEKIDEMVSTLNTKVTELENNVQEFSQKNEEQATTISTLEQEKSDMTTELEEKKTAYTEAQDKINELTEQNEALESFKAAAIVKEKEAILDKYNSLLNDDVLDSFKARFDELNPEELDKELAFTLVQSKPTLFSGNEGTPYAPKDDAPEEGITGILNRYKK